MTPPAVVRPSDAGESRVRGVSRGCRARRTLLRPAPRRRRRRGGRGAAGPHGLASNDVSDVPGGPGVYSFLLDRRGRVVVDLRILPVPGFEPDAGGAGHRNPVAGHAGRCPAGSDEAPSEVRPTDSRGASRDQCCGACAHRAARGCCARALGNGCRSRLSAAPRRTDPSRSDNRASRGSGRPRGSPGGDRGSRVRPVCGSGWRRARRGTVLHTTWRRRHAGRWSGGRPLGLGDSSVGAGIAGFGSELGTERLAQEAGQDDRAISFAKGASPARRSSPVSTTAAT